MSIRLGFAGVAALGCLFWLARASQREKALIAPAPLAALRLLEDEAAAHPGAAAPTRALAQAYLDARQPGLAVVLVEKASPTVGTDVRVRHVHARALIDEGRNGEALAVENAVVAACRAMAAGSAATDGCDPVLVASATRRTDILRQLVLLGVDDAQAHPEESYVAYRNATREARVMLP